MRRLMLAAALSGGTLMVGYGTAAAQVALEFPGAGVYVGPGYYYDDDYYHDDRYYYGPTYGYHRDRRDSRSGHERRRDRTVCGRYSYFDGSNCQPGRRPY